MTGLVLEMIQGMTASESLAYLEELRESLGIVIESLQYDIDAITGKEG